MSFLDQVKATYRIVSGIMFDGFPYYHVSDHEGLPTIHEDTPLTYKDPEGIYLFIKGEGISVDEWGEKKWRWDAKLKSEQDFLLIDRFWKDFDKVLDHLGLTWEQAYKKIEGNQKEDDFYETFHEIESEWNLQEVKAYFKKNYWRLYEVIRGIINDRKKLTSLFKSLGYKGIIDHEGSCIYSGEPQVIVFNKDDVIWGEREENIPDDTYLQLG